MRTLACNCRGAGKASTVRSLRSLIRNSSPNLVFLSETKIKALRVEKIRVKLNFVDSFCVDAIRGCQWLLKQFGHFVETWHGIRGSLFKQICYSSSNLL